MGFFDWLFGRKETPSLESVIFNYKTRTGSTREKPVVVDAANAREAALKHGFKFVDFVVDGIRLASVDQKQNGNVYEVYQADSRAVALHFLESIPQNKIPELYYVIVETPGGNVGKDRNGVFDE